MFQKYPENFGFQLPYRGKKTRHKINRVKLLVGGNFSHFSPTKFSVLGK